MRPVSPLEQLARAMRVQGPRPDVHAKAVEDLQRTWPTLWAAIERLLRIHDLTVAHNGAPPVTPPCIDTLRQMGPARSALDDALLILFGDQQAVIADLRSQVGGGTKGSPLAEYVIKESRYLCTFTPTKEETLTLVRALHAQGLVMVVWPADADSQCLTIGTLPGTAKVTHG